MRNAAGPTVDSICIAKTAEWAAQICGVPPDTIIDLARRTADLRSFITCSWSLQRAHRGEQPYWAAITLAAIVGGIGLPGRGFGFGHGTIRDVADVLFRRATELSLLDKY